MTFMPLVNYATEPRISNLDIEYRISNLDIESRISNAPFGLSRFVYPDLTHFCNSISLLFYVFYIHSVTILY
jgi:hypothetical protein